MFITGSQVSYGVVEALYSNPCYTTRWMYPQPK